MPFSIRFPHRFPVQCVVTYSVGPFRASASVESVAFGLAFFWRLADATWGKPLIDRHAAE